MRISTALILRMEKKWTFVGRSKKRLLWRSGFGSVNLDMKMRTIKMKARASAWPSFRVRSLGCESRDLAFFPVFLCSSSSRRKDGNGPDPREMASNLKGFFCAANAHAPTHSYRAQTLWRTSACETLRIATFSRNFTIFQTRLLSACRKWLEHFFGNIIEPSTFIVWCEEFYLDVAMKIGFLPDFLFER